MDEPLPTPPVLDYADAYSCIVIEQHAGGVRIVVPPLMGWRAIPKRWLLLTVILVLFAFAPALGYFGASDYRHVVPGFIFSGFVLVMLAFHVAGCFDLLRRRIIIDVNDRVLAVYYYSSVVVPWSLSRQCDSSLEIRVSATKDKIVFLAKGLDPVKLFISSDHAAVERIAVALRLHCVAGVDSHDEGF